MKLKLNKLIFTIFFMILFLNVVNAQIGTLGTFSQSSEVRLKQTCANCTFVNITSVTSPDSTENLGQVIMSQIGTEFFFNLPSANTSKIGRYIVDGIGDDGGVLDTFNYDFFITPSGKTSTTSESILYTMVIIVSLILFFFSLFVAIRIPFQNFKDKLGNITGINYWKYLKLMSMWLSHLSLIFFLTGFLAIIINFVSLNATINIITLIYRFVYIMFYPVTLFMFFTLFSLVWKDILYNKEIIKHGKAFIEGND